VIVNPHAACETRRGRRPRFGARRGRGGGISPRPRGTGRSRIDGPPGARPSACWDRSSKARAGWLAGSSGWHTVPNERSPAIPSRRCETTTE
jgi:hypothetical protein